MTDEPRILICYGCRKECNLKRDGEWLDSDCCSGVIVDQYGFDWTQDELAEISAANSEMAAEDKAREEAG